MGKLVIFSILLAVVLVYPIYEIVNEKGIKGLKPPKNLSLVTIRKGDFFNYDQNLLQKGAFERLDVYKKYYKTFNIIINNLEKNETFKAQKAKFIGNILYANDFFYHNSEYNFTSDFVTYNTKSKNIKGNKFFLIGKTFKARGMNFLIDKNRNIVAYKPIFDLKVNK